MHFLKKDTFGAQKDLIAVFFVLLAFDTCLKTDMKKKENKKREEEDMIP